MNIDEHFKTLNPRITSVPDSVLLAIGLIGTIIILVCVGVLVKNRGGDDNVREGRPREATDRDYAPNELGSASGSDDDDNYNYNVRGNGEGEEKLGTREERRARKINTMKAEKADAKKRAREERGKEDGCKKPVGPRDPVKDAARDEEEDRLLEQREFAEWRTRSGQSGEWRTSLDEISAVVGTGGHTLDLSATGDALGLTSAEMERRLHFLVEQGAVLGYFDGPSRFISFSSAEIERLAATVASQERVNLEDLSAAIRRPPLEARGPR